MFMACAASLASGSHLCPSAKAAYCTCLQQWLRDFWHIACLVGLIFVTHALSCCAALLAAEEGREPATHQCVAG
jgi:hypothetical protein